LQRYDVFLNSASFKAKKCFEGDSPFGRLTNPTCFRGPFLYNGGLLIDPHLNEIEDKQMYGVEAIEDIFGERSLDKTSTPVVHADGNKGQTNNPSET